MSTLALTTVPTERHPKPLVHPYRLSTMMEQVDTFLCKVLEILPLTVVWKISHIDATSFATTPCWRSVWSWSRSRSWSWCWWCRWWRSWTMVSWRGSSTMTRRRRSVATMAVIVVIWIVVVVMSAGAFQVWASAVWREGSIARIGSIVRWTGCISWIRFSCVSIAVVSVRRRERRVVAHINKCKLQPECRLKEYKL